MKTPTTAHAIRPDGTTVGLPMLRKLNRQRHRQQHGPLARGFHEQLRRQSPDAMVPAAIYFRPNVNWRDLAPRLFSRDQPTVE